MNAHVVQSPEWGRFKTEYGTKAVRVGKVQYTLHKLPMTDLNLAYAPRVNPEQIEWENLENSLKSNKCIAINFDVPNVIKGTPQEETATKILKEHCTRSQRDTFAKHNILMDLKPSEEELLENMHKKLRYNINYAKKKGVEISFGNTQQDFEDFYELLTATALRQRYYIHPKKYYQLIWEHLKPLDMCHIVTAKYQGEILASWMLFSYEKTLYYPYGGSAEKHKNLFASSLVAWEAIKLGKFLGCTTFDMWGAAADPQDTNDPWYGFTNFKLKFGGKYVEYIDSYDFVVNKPLYNLFNISNTIRWKLLRLLK